MTDHSAEHSAERRDELSSGLASVRERIANACAAADRAEDSVTLIVVTKYFGASDVRLLAELGVRDVGENRHQEAQAKQAECADLGLRWHYIGGMQSNKAAAIAEYADMVHSLDRAKLVTGLANGVARSARSVLDVLIQVSLDGPHSSHRNGVAADELIGLAQRVEHTDELRLRGLMAVAPLDEEPQIGFARLAEIRREFEDSYPDARVLSAGMSNDLEVAISVGATHVRVGSAILGSRPAVG